LGGEINLVLLGSGYWGSKLAGEYLQLQSESGGKFNFVGVADPDRAKLSSISTKFSLPSDMLFTDVKRCISDPDITAVHIATPSETHYDLAYHCLSSRKHILLEKPMAMNTRDAFKLTRIAEKSGSVLLVGHVFRFNSALAKAKQMIDSLNIGDLKYLAFSWLDYLNPIPQRDIVFDLLPHPIDILNYLTDEWPSSVYVAHNKDTRDMAFAILEMPDKKVVQITLSWVQVGLKERRVIITGSEGSMIVDTLSQHVTVCRREDTHHVEVVKNNTIRSMIEHFTDCISRRDTPSNSSLIGAMTVNILSTARKSLIEGRVLKIFE
jgi:UDP-N-acetylglucosamine 3-dehydrogenase